MGTVVNDENEYIDRDITLLIDSNIDYQIQYENNLNRNMDDYLLYIDTLERVSWNGDFVKFNRKSMNQIFGMNQSIHFDIKDEIFKELSRTTRKSRVIYWRFLRRRENGLGN
jgi:hypothetical protein